MSRKIYPFEGKSNAECIELVDMAIDYCKEAAKKLHSNFQSELDVLIEEIDNHTASSPHFLALIKSFKKVAEQIEEREKSNLEWSNA